MLDRIFVIAQNTYREAVRARVLHGLLLLALATAGYSQIVGLYALKSSLRVVGDLGAASLSLYSVVVAIVLGATSLHRELELKTLFPILARPIHRHEYLLGKYLGALFTLAVFDAANSGVMVLSLAMVSREDYLFPPLLFLGVAAAGVAAGYRWPRARTFLPALCALVLLGAAWPLASGAADDRRVIVGAALLSLAEVAVVTALATFFASFSSPFLTAIFTLGVFVIGRSADTLARLPERVFGRFWHLFGVVWSKIMPNLMVYVPPRTLLTGEAAGVALGPYVGLAALQAVAWAVLLLSLSSLIFRKRDFL